MVVKVIPEEQVITQLPILNCSKLQILFYFNIFFYLWFIYTFNEKLKRTYLYLYTHYLFIDRNWTYLVNKKPHRNGYIILSQYSTGSKTDTIKSFHFWNYNDTMTKSRCGYPVFNFFYKILPMYIGFKII